jgi:hypothetical protein
LISQLMCLSFINDTCNNKFCPFAHGPTEFTYTSLCLNFLNGSCTDKKCSFSHDYKCFYNSKYDKVNFPSIAKTVEDFFC